MDDYSNLEKIESDYSDLIMNDRGTDHSDFLLQRIPELVDIKERSLFMATIISELQRWKRFAEAEEIIRELATLYPDEPFSWIRLAEHFHYYDVNLSKALEYINKAIDVALIDKSMVYHAIGVKIRIAISMKKWAVVTQALEMATTYNRVAKKIDMIPETDFIAKIPTDKVSLDLIKEYEALSAKCRAEMNL